MVETWPTEFLPPSIVNTEMATCQRRAGFRSIAAEVT